MGSMRFQPQGLSRIRGDLLGRVVGATFTNNRLEIGGSGAEVNLFGNPELITGPGSTLGRRMVAASNCYAAITPSEGIVDFTNTTPWAVVQVFTPQTLGVASRILSYRHALDNNGIQLCTTSTNRLGFWFGSSSGSGSTRASNTGFALEAGVTYTAVFGWDGGYFLYINGVSHAGTNAGTFVTSNAGTTTDINIGRRNTGSSYFDGTVLLAAHIRGSVDGAALSLNPWQIFEDGYEQDDFLVSSAAVVEPAKFSGVASLQVSASGALSTSIRLSGASALLASASGALSTGIRLSCAAVAQVSAAGTLTTAVRLTGAAAMRVSAAGALAGAGVALSGAASVQASASGELSTSISLTGAASVRASASGSLDGTAVVLEGAAAVRVSAAGALATSIPLVGDAVAQLSAAGSFAGTAAGLSGASGLILAGAGALDTSINLSGLAVTRVAASGAVTTRVRLVGAASAQASAAGTLGNVVVYARAPAGSGYTPQRSEYQVRPAQASAGRPSSTEKNYR